MVINIRFRKTVLLSVCLFSLSHMAMGQKVVSYTDATKGDTYAAISMSNPSGKLTLGAIDRTTDVVSGNQRSFYTTTVYERAGTEPFTADINKPLPGKYKKMLRHTSYYYRNSSNTAAGSFKITGSYGYDDSGEEKPSNWTVYPNISPDRYVSAHFAVSPTEVSSIGDVLPSPINSNKMRWSVAAGYTGNANSVPFNEQQNAINTGCFNYKGKSGADEVGTWRLPTAKELQLIHIMDKALAKVSGAGYNPLVGGNDATYWCGTNITAMNSPITYAVGLIFCRPCTTGANASRDFFNDINIAAATAYIRCVKDLKP